MKISVHLLRNPYIVTLHRNILQHNSLALVNKYLAQIDNFSFSCQPVGLLNLKIRLIHMLYSVLVL